MSENSDPIMFPSLQDARILVLGSSGQLGSKIAKLLSRQGASLYLTYFSHRERAEALLAESRPNVPAFAGPCDIRNSQSVADAFRCANDRLGGIDGVVCSVGSQRRKGLPLLSASDEELRELVTVQIEGALYCCRECARNLNSGGSVVFVSSVIGTRGFIPEQSPHASAKAAMNRLVEHAAIELAPKIRVNAVAPGYIHLGTNEPGDPEVLARLTQAIPLRKAGSPEQVANAVCFLLSSASAFTTGTILHVDGGLFL